MLFYFILFYFIFYFYFYFYFYFLAIVQTFRRDYFTVCLARKNCTRIESTPEILFLKLLLGHLCKILYKGNFFFFQRNGVHVFTKHCTRYIVLSTAYVTLYIARR